MLTRADTFGTLGGENEGKVFEKQRGGGGGRPGGEIPQAEPRF